MLAGPVPLDPARLTASETPLSAFSRDNDPRLPASGRELFDVVWSGAVALEWRHLMDVHGADLRLYLHLDALNLPGLQKLSWELLTDGIKPLLTTIPVIRTSVFPPKRDAFTPIWPVRVFVINAADPKDKGIKAAQEIWNIRRALRSAEHSFDLEVYDLANKPNFDPNKVAEAVPWPEGPHIIHFIGHSVPGALHCYVRKTDTYYEWTLAQIENFTNQFSDLRLFYANSCRSQEDGPEPATPWSVATAPLSRAVAVIAMQTDVGGEAAALCAHQFYAHLAKRRSVDIALQKARQSLLNRFKETSRELYAPVLTTRVAARDILPMRDFEWDDHKHESWQSALKENWAHFVNQRPHRRKLFRALFDPMPCPPGLVILGERGVGKSWLIKWYAYSMALNHLKVHYLPTDESPDWLELLRDLRDGKGTLYSSGLDPAQHHEFNWKLNHLAQGKLPPPYPAGSAVRDDGDPHSVIMRKSAQVDGFASAVCEAMVEALKKQSLKSPLVLVLDGPSVPILKTLKEPLLDRLVDKENAASIRVIICCDPAHWKSYQDQILDFSDWQQIIVSDIDKPEIASVTCELLRLLFPARDTSHVESFLEVHPPDPMKAGLLYPMCQGLGLLNGS
jgi:hypothetical protein